MDDHTVQPENNQDDSFIMRRYVKPDSELTHEQLCDRWADNHPLGTLVFLYLFAFILGFVALLSIPMRMMFDTLEMSPWFILFMPGSVAITAIQYRLLLQRAHGMSREELTKNIKRMREIRDESPI